MKRMLSGMTATIALVALGLLVPSAAHAIETDSGTTVCSNRVGAVQSYSDGTTEIWAPGGGYGYYYNHGWTTRTRDSDRNGGGSWQVWSYYLLNTSSTYGFCRAYAL